MNKEEKKLLNKMFNSYINNYCKVEKVKGTSGFSQMTNLNDKIINDICDFMRKYKI
jgi:hypothetical protein|tara:strand:- start:305 stop:472 length:168 start_codon:yes stop_codon:yes gene_type:complete